MIMKIKFFSPVFRYKVIKFFKIFNVGQRPDRSLVMIVPIFVLILKILGKFCAYRFEKVISKKTHLDHCSEDADPTRYYRLYLS